ncbi:hypothetical protein OOK44_38215 [Streptomyces cellulosae]|uniref:hypothetical protein n=1 Tax=Streptomyces cellulosae TaxID=1968 RepID=UPI00224F9735|nr:hypothetical protein [Streptomyces cellulosae]MCX4482213.1 hypothetical protein [Streptomyces cellulosae]
MTTDLTRSPGLPPLPPPPLPALPTEPVPAPRTRRWVYLIGSPQARPVRLGVSTDPDGDLTRMRADSPVPLLILWRTRGGPGLLGRLRDYLAPYRSHGDWYDFGEENATAIVATAAVLMGYRTQPRRAVERLRYEDTDCTSCAARRVQDEPQPEDQGAPDGGPADQEPGYRPLRDQIADVLADEPAGLPLQEIRRRLGCGTEDGPTPGSVGNAVSHMTQTGALVATGRAHYRLPG